MIVSDKYGFVIANPPKTGTTSLHALVDKWIGSGGSPRVLCHLRGETRTRHRLAPPQGKEDYQRYMMSRDPKTRLTSMYEFLRLRESDQRWIAPAIQDQERRYGREAAWLWLLTYIVEVRATEGYDRPGHRGVHGSQPYMWCDNQREMLDYMTGLDLNGGTLGWFRLDDVEAQPLRMEAFKEDWEDLLMRFEVEEDSLWDVSLPRRNAVPDDERLFSDPAAYWRVPGASDVLRKIMGGPRGLMEEMRQFGTG